MDIFRLDPVTLLPTDLVEDYSSAVWTERHGEDSEFELRTAKVAETKLFLPEGSLISHLDTDEVMKVETHLIEKDEEENEILLIKGRTLLAPLLEDRAIFGYEYGKEWNAYQYYTTSEVITALVWNYLANDSGVDILSGSMLLNEAYKVENLVVTDSTRLTEDQKAWFFKDGELHAQLKDLLAIHNFGVRVVRPSDTSGNVVSFDTTVQSFTRGVRTLTPITDIQALRLDLYEGFDRTRDQQANTPVVFSYEFGDIDDPSYLFSARQLKNMALLRASTGTQEIWAETGSATPPAVIPTGADLRILYFDAGSPDTTPPTEPETIPIPPDTPPSKVAKINAQNAQNQEVYSKALVEHQTRLANFEVEIVEKAVLELQKYNRSIVFDGAISPLSTYKYRDQYFLGDRVTLSAEYGVENTMIVSEYVRTEDQTGDRGYPTLVLAE